VGTTNPERSMFENLRLRDWNVPHLLAPGFALDGKIGRQGAEATRTLPWSVIDDAGHVHRAQLDPSVAGVADLSSSFAARRFGFGARRCARRISRGWTRRIARILLNPRQEISELLLECRKLFFDRLNPPCRDDNLTFEKGKVHVDRGRQSHSHLGRNGWHVTHGQTLAVGRLLA
jgi:hypothetical protein